LGTTLVAILAAPAIAELAKGIADWMRRRNIAVTISADGGKTLEGPPEHIENILRTLTKGEEKR
jgi:hypothetical protein